MEKLMFDISNQGLRVRKLKSEQAEKEIIEKEVEILKNLKLKLKLF